jgi:hypothetical protein
MTRDKSVSIFECSIDPSTLPKSDSEKVIEFDPNMDRAAHTYLRGVRAMLLEAGARG